MDIKKILVSQPKPSSEKSPYYTIAEKYGIEIAFHPFIKVVSLTPKEFRQQKVSISEFTAVVFTSRHAVDHFFSLCKEMRVNIPETMKYFCVTESVALYIQKYVQYRKRKVFFGKTGMFADLVPIMAKHKTEKYFVPLSDVHNNVIAAKLDAHKLLHKEAVMYRTVSNEFPEDMHVQDYDMIIFFSPLGVQALKENLPDYVQGDTAFATFGPATAKEVEKEGFRLDLSAPTKESPSMTAALDTYLKENK